MAAWAAKLGFKGIQIPTWDKRLFDLQKAAETEGYCEDILGIAGRAGIAITELATHLQGQLVASHSTHTTRYWLALRRRSSQVIRKHASNGPFSSCFGLRKLARNWA